MDWTEKHVLSLLRHDDATKTRHKRGRRLLTSHDITLLAEASSPGAMSVLQDTLHPGNVTLSTTLLSDAVTCKRTMGDSQLAAARHLALTVLQVRGNHVIRHSPLYR